MIRQAVELQGLVGAARRLGVGRGVLLAVLAGTGVLPATIALLRERTRYCEAV